MSLKRLVLISLTLVAIAISGLALLSSWQEPQFQSRLELYQTNILLQATSAGSADSKDESLQALRNALLGEKPLQNAMEQYQEARKSAHANLDKTKNQLAKLRSAPVAVPKSNPEIPPAANTSSSVQEQQLQKSLNQLRKLTAQLDLDVGILQARQGEINAAKTTWSQLQQNTYINLEFVKLGEILTGLWSVPPRLLPNAEPLIQDNLEGWFRFTALSQLYKLQQRQESLTNLNLAQQDIAQQAVVKLAIIGLVPVIATFFGVGLLIFLIGQRLLKGKAALLAQNEDVRWSTLWDGDTILQVFVVGFFLMGQLLVPIVLSILPIPRPVGNVRLQALFVLVSYLLVAFGALSVLFLSIKRYFPLPENWFNFNVRDNWFVWGLGGYCVAFPIVVVVSLINQQLWHGQGGSNPLLQLALEGQDFVALGIFFFTAAIAAPVFEEFLFRGFLLPSLTRYLSVWGAILVSSLLFAIAHLSLSEVLPLFALGIVLGMVYTRSRNLLAPILLHSLWNSGTLLSLFILGSSK
jgi:membrane protease YdiL (CAAX protease family)